MSMSATENELPLAQRVALVTGGARGIGLAIVKQLHALGASVVVADSGVSIAGQVETPGLAASVATELGQRAAPFAEHLDSAEAAAAAVAFASRCFGALDIVVNNAAILRDGFVFKLGAADWDAVIKNNLSAAFYVLSAATPTLREQVKAGRAAGRIVNITSSAGVYGNFGQVAYASAKAGLFGLTRVVAMDMARSGVTCNAVAPFAATRVTDAIRPANPAQAEYKARALRVPARAVAELVGALCCEEAAGITGQLLGVRGREVFLFSQPRPAARLETPAAGLPASAYATSLASHFASGFTDLGTDLEAFNTEPLL